jgi:hypothetical protein
MSGDVVSVDVIDPRERCLRNSARDVEGPTTITELLAEWPEASGIRFLQSTGAQWLSRYAARVAVAFVDGKHTFVAVREEGDLLAQWQHHGDLVVWDDIQIPAVARAVAGLSSLYEVEYLQSTPERRYAVGRRK